MRIKESFVRLERVRLHGLHGVLPQERRVGNDYELSLRIGYPLQAAMQSDRVEDTLNYASVYDLVREEFAKPSALIEHVAARLADALFAAFPAITTIDLLLTKRNPPMGAACDGASVELHLINDKTEASAASFTQ